MKKITITNTRAQASAEANKKFKEEKIKCSSCEKWVSIHSVYPAYNHPEAPPVCFDCLPDEVKEALNKVIEKPLAKEDE